MTKWGRSKLPFAMMGGRGRKGNSPRFPVLLCWSALIVGPNALRSRAVGLANSSRETDLGRVGDRSSERWRRRSPAARGLDTSEPVGFNGTPRKSPGELRNVRRLKKVLNPAFGPQSGSPCFAPGFGIRGVRTNTALLERRFLGCSFCPIEQRDKVSSYSAMMSPCSMALARARHKRANFAAIFGHASAPRCEGRAC